MEVSKGERIILDSYREGTRSREEVRLAVMKVKERKRDGEGGDGASQPMFVPVLKRRHG